MPDDKAPKRNVALWACINAFILFLIPCAVCWLLINVLQFPWYCTVPAMIVFVGLELFIVIGVMAQAVEKAKEKP